MTSTLAVFIACLVACATHASSQSCIADLATNSSVFISPNSTAFHDALGSFTLLGASTGDFANHIRTAVQANWHDFAASGGGTVTGGVLQNDSQLIAKFASLGVSPGKMVVIYGSWADGWGDEGRIHWMLKYLGHTKAYILAGGGGPYLQAHPENLVASNVSAPVAVNIAEWQTGLNPMMNILAMKADVTAGNVLLIDTRTLGEYNGTLLNPAGTGAAYGVQRLGHAAGAVRFSYPDFFSNGCLLTCTAFQAKLVALGWTPGMKLVSYCTAGIRSGFFWSVVQNCGLGAAANYAGSMWEYAADNSLTMETSGKEVAQTSWGGRRSAGSLATASLLAVLGVVMVVG